MVFFFTPKKKKEEDPLDDFSLKKHAVKSFQDAMRTHDRALRDLEASLRTCIQTMEAVAVSLHNLSTEAQVVPVVINVSGALQRGLAALTAEDGADGCAAQWEELQEEIEFSMKTRFADVFAAHRDLEGCRRRRSKAKKDLDSLQSECEKLSKRASPCPSPAEGQATPTTTAHDDALRRKETQELEFKRLHCEFEDDYAIFVAKLGAAVQDDMRGIIEAIRNVLTAVSYQFRKCEENLGCARLANPQTSSAEKAAAC